MPPDLSQDPHIDSEDLGEEAQLTQALEEEIRNFLHGRAGHEASSGSAGSRPQYKFLRRARHQVGLQAQPAVSPSMLQQHGMPRHSEPTPAWSPPAAESHSQDEFAELEE